MRSRLLFAVLAIACVGVADAVPRAATCRPVVRDAWVRLPPAMPMGAGYFTLTNPCRMPVVLTGARSDRFADVSMHETRIVDGVSRMQALPPVTLAPGARLPFAPGGRHLMLMAPRGEIRAGTRVRLELSFADGGRVAVDAPVRAAAP